MTDDEIKEMRDAAQRRMSALEGLPDDGDIVREAFIALDKRFRSARRVLAREILARLKEIS